MKILGFLRTVAIAGFLIGTSHVQAETIRCKMASDANRYYIAPTVELEIGEFGKVRVVDDIIKSTDREAVFGDVEIDNAKRLTIFWTVSGVQPDPKESRFQDPDLIVRFTIQKSSGATVMTVLDSQSRKHQYRANGTCRIGG